MTRLPFREFHILEILHGWEGNSPLDLWLSNYFRDHKAIGSKDRAYIADTLYGLIRWLGAIDHFANEDFSWDHRLDIFLKTDFSEVYRDSTLPPHIRVSFPPELFDLIAADYGVDQALELCYASNFPAPTTIRANALKISREALLERWQGIYDISPTPVSPIGIAFNKKISFFSLPEFKEGLFEVQDEASQLVANLLEAKPGDIVLDYCSGSGGKTLAFASRLEGKGQIFLHDIRDGVLLQARKRLKRAGIQNAQTLPFESPKLQRLKQRCDWVFADVPCSGTGTLRRNPDLKWKFDDDTLKRLCGTQRAIFEKALSFLKWGGHIVYATCSILKEENQQQVEHFLSTYPLELVGEPFQSLPQQGCMDGFYAAVFRKTKDDKHFFKESGIL